MSGWEATAAGWLLRSALGGGVILFLAWLGLRRTRQPARQQRLGEWGLTAALLLTVIAVLPGWLHVPVPVPAAPAATTTPTAEDGEPPAPADARLAVLLWLLTWSDPSAVPASPPTAPAPAADTSVSVNLSELLPLMPGWLALVYVAVAAGLLARWLLGHAALWRLLRTARPAAQEVVRLFKEMTPERHRPRLLVSDRLPTPISCGLLRPTIVLPATLGDDPAALRWVFAHELAHLRRRDLWTCWLFGLGEAVFFYLPWFWWLRRQVRLCQEYLADAAVLDQDAPPADCAQFLLTMNAVAAPAGATGVSGRPSELFRRVSMMLRSPGPLERRCPGAWSCAVAGFLVGLAVLVGGVRLSATTPEPVAPDPPAAPTPQSPVLTIVESLPVPEAPAEPPQPANPPVATPAINGAILARSKDNRLGVRVEKLEPALAEQLDIPVGTGLVVVEVIQPQSPAVRVGVKVHDVLVTVGGLAIPSDPRGLAALTQDLPAGTTLEVRVLRKGRPLTLSGLTLSAPRPLPTVQVPSLGGLRLGPPAGVTTLLSQNGPQFQARQTEGSLSITIIGTVTDGNARPASVVVQDGVTVHAGRTADDVPEKHRDRVRQLLDMVARGAVPTKSP